jgi:hypothetical protein
VICQTCCRLWLITGMTLPWSVKSGHRVPDDLALVTVGDSRWVDDVHPAVTAVHGPMYRMARRVTESCWPPLTVRTGQLMRP